MSQKNILTISIIISLIILSGIAYYFYRPDWQVEKIVREGESNTQTVQSVIADRSRGDFKFSPVMNGMTAHIADMPANASILSLHVVLNEIFEGENGESPSMQVIIQNDNGTACTMDITNITGEIQLLATGKICAIGEKSSLLIRDASAMHGFKSGDMKVLLSFVSF